MIGLDDITETARGLIVVSAADAIRFVRDGKTRSMEALALLAITVVDIPADSNLECSNLTWPGILTDTEEPLLVRGTIIQLGDIRVDPRVGKPATSVIETDLLRVTVFRDQWPLPWNQFTAGPLKAIIARFPCLQLCLDACSNGTCHKFHPAVEESHLRMVVLDAFAWKWHDSTGKSTQSAKSCSFSLMIRIPQTGTNAFLGVSGIDGLYNELRDSTTNATHPKFAVIWIDGDFDAARHRLRSLDKALHLVRFHQKYGLRCLKKDEAFVHDLVFPNQKFVDCGTKLQFESGPWPYGITKQSLAEFLEQFKWVAKPLKPIRGGLDGRFWLLGSSTEPPATVTTYGDQFVTITKVKDGPVGKPAPNVVASVKTMQRLSHTASSSDSDPWLNYDPSKSGSTGSKVVAAAPAGPSASKLDEIEARLTTKFAEQLQEQIRTVADEAMPEEDPRLAQLQVSVKELQSQQKTFSSWFQDAADKMGQMSTKITQQDQRMDQMHEQLTANTAATDQLGAQLNTMNSNFRSDLAAAMDKQMSNFEALLCKSRRTEWLPRQPGGSRWVCHFWILWIFAWICRVGEAARPGPEPFVLGVANPSGLTGKSAAFLDLDAGIWNIAETQATAVGFQRFAKELRAMQAPGRQLRVSHGAFAPPRVGSHFAGSWTGVAQMSDCPQRSMVIPWRGAEYESGRVMVSTFMLGPHHVTGACVYAPPRGPTYGDAATLTAALLGTITEELVLGRKGPRFVAGDFNQPPDGLAAFERWRSLGWLECQDLAAIRFSPDMCPLVKVEHDRTVWISPEMQPWVQAVSSSDENFADHATLQVHLEIPDRHVWRSPPSFLGIWCNYLWTFLLKTLTTGMPQISLGLFVHGLFKLKGNCWIKSLMLFQLTRAWLVVELPQPLWSFLWPKCPSRVDGLGMFDLVPPSLASWFINGSSNFDVFRPTCVVLSLGPCLLRWLPISVVLGELCCLPPDLILPLNNGGVIVPFRFMGLLLLFRFCHLLHRRHDSFLWTLKQITAPWSAGIFVNAPKLSRPHIMSAIKSCFNSFDHRRLLRFPIFGFRILPWLLLCMMISWNLTLSCRIFRMLNGLWMDFLLLSLVFLTWTLFRFSSFLTLTLHWWDIESRPPLFALTLRPLSCSFMDFGIPSGSVIKSWLTITGIGSWTVPWMARTGLLICFKPPSLDTKRRPLVAPTPGVVLIFWLCRIPGAWTYAICSRWLSRDPPGLLNWSLALCVPFLRLRIQICPPIFDLWCSSVSFIGFGRLYLPRSSCLASSSLFPHTSMATYRPVGCQICGASSKLPSRCHFWPNKASVDFALTLSSASIDCLACPCLESWNTLDFLQPRSLDGRMPCTLCNGDSRSLMTWVLLMTPPRAFRRETLWVALPWFVSTLSLMLMFNNMLLPVLLFRMLITFSWFRLCLLNCMPVCWFCRPLWILGTSHWTLSNPMRGLLVPPTVPLSRPLVTLSSLLAVISEHRCITPFDLPGMFLRVASMTSPTFGLSYGHPPLVLGFDAMLSGWLLGPKYCTVVSQPGFPRLSWILFDLGACMHWSGIALAPTLSCAGDWWCLLDLTLPISRFGMCWSTFGALSVCFLSFAKLGSVLHLPLVGWVSCTQSEWPWIFCTGPWMMIGCSGEVGSRLLGGTLTLRILRPWLAMLGNSRCALGWDIERIFSIWGPLMFMFPLVVSKPKIGLFPNWFLRSKMGLSVSMLYFLSSTLRSQSCVPSAGLLTICNIVAWFALAMNGYVPNTQMLRFFGDPCHDSSQTMGLWSAIPFCINIGQLFCNGRTLWRILLSILSLVSYTMFSRMAPVFALPLVRRD